MTDDLKTWFDNIFWPTYPNDLCEGRKGPKGEAWNEIVKLKPDETERNRILENIRAHILADRKIKNAGKWLERWPHVRRYIKHRWWDNEVKSFSEAETRKSPDRCECGELIMTKGHCIKCYEQKIKPQIPVTHAERKFAERLNKLNEWIAKKNYSTKEGSCRELLMRKGILNKMLKHLA